MYKRQSRLGRSQARNLEGPLGDIRASGTVLLVWFAGILAGVVLIVVVANHDWFTTDDVLRSSKGGTPIPAAAATSAAGQLLKPPASAASGGTTSGGSAAAGDVQAGLAKFGSSGCTSCHLNNGLAAGVGPSLNGVTTRRSDAYITNNIRNGKGSMPAFPASSVSDTDITNIIAYLHTLT